VIAAVPARGSDRRDLFQYPLRAVDDRIIDEFIIELDGRPALTLRSGEGGEPLPSLPAEFISRIKDPIDVQRPVPNKPSSAGGPITVGA
jgi:hypothetical protein